MTGFNGATYRLCKAFEGGDISACRREIRAGADVNAILDSGRTVLQVAVDAAKGRADIVTLLVDSGADVNRKEPDTDSALSLAVASRYTEVCEVLFEAGADLELRSAQYGLTPLASAAYYGRTDLFKRLVELGALLDTPHEGIITDDALTPFQAAVKEGEVEIVRYCLLELGLDPNSETREGRSLTQLAGDNLEIKELILACRAQLAIQNAVAGEAVCDDGPREVASGRCNPSAAL